jgi:hypothetical protein
VSSISEVEVENDEENEERLIIDHLFAVIQLKQTKKMTKEEKRNNPCFSFALTGRCAAGRDCKFSHDRSKCEEHMGKIAQQVNQSPFTTATHRKLEKVK